MKRWKIRTIITNETLVYIAAAAVAAAVSLGPEVLIIAIKSHDNALSTVVTTDFEFKNSRKFLYTIV
jgi:hypothetical protein